MMRSHIASWSAACAVTLAARAQTIYYVDAECGDDRWSGLTSACSAPDGPKRSIAAAWALAGDGDVVSLAPGVYSGPDNRSIAFDARSRTLRGERGAERTLLDGVGSQDPAIVVGDGGVPASRVEGIGFRGFADSAVVCFDFTNIELLRCRFEGNTSRSAGGAVWGSHAQLSIVNCEFAGNSAATDGGAVAVYASEMKIVNCTFIRNVAAGSGQSVHAFALATMTSSIARGGTGQLSSLGLLEVRYSNIEGGYPGDGNIDAEPVFVDPARGDYRLGAGSPGIDAGLSAALPPGATIDLDGAPRRVDDPATPDTGPGPAPVVDMGALEYQACRPDLTGDGQLDLFDFLAFQNLFAAGDPRADFDGDGALTLFDFLAFQNEFAAGCG